MHDDLYMSSSTSLASLIRHETISDLRTLAFYNHQISALERRMNLIATPHFTTMTEAQDRLTDLTSAAEHILQFNECYDALWEQTHFTDELLDDSSVIIIDETPFPCPDRAPTLNTALPLPQLPCEDITAIRTITPEKTAQKPSVIDPNDLNFTDPVSSYTRLANEPRVSDSTSFRPCETTRGRNAGKIPSKFLQKFAEEKADEHMLLQLYLY